MLVAIEIMETGPSGIPNIDKKVVCYFETRNIKGVSPMDYGSMVAFVDGTQSPSPTPAESIAMMINQAEISQHQDKWLAVERVKGY